MIPSNLVEGCLQCLGASVYITVLCCIPSYPTFQCTHCALGRPVGQDRHQHCRDGTYKISGPQECHHIGTLAKVLPKSILWFQSFYPCISGVTTRTWLRSVSWPTIGSAERLRCLWWGPRLQLSRAIWSPCRGGPVVWTEMAAWSRWNPPSWTSRGWQAFQYSLQSDFLDVDIYISIYNWLYRFSISYSSIPCPTLIALWCRDGDIYHDMDGNPTTSQANRMEFQPLGWKSIRRKNSKKLKVLDFAHA